MNLPKIYKFAAFFSIIILTFNSCAKLPGADARKYPADPKETASSTRVVKNHEHRSSKPCCGRTKELYVDWPRVGEDVTVSIDIAGRSSVFRLRC